MERQHDPINNWLTLQLILMQMTSKTVGFGRFACVNVCKSCTDDQSDGFSGWRCFAGWSWADERGLSGPCGSADSVSPPSPEYSRRNLEDTPSDDFLKKANREKVTKCKQSNKTLFFFLPLYDFNNNNNILYCFLIVFNNFIIIV